MTMLFIQSIFYMLLTVLSIGMLKLIFQLKTLNGKV